jgi:hypothetical protein
VIDHRGAEAVVAAGTHVASETYVSGFLVLEAPSLDVARGLAAEASKACHRRVELRAFLGR